MARLRRSPRSRNRGLIAAPQSAIVGTLLEALLPPAECRLEALLARDLAELLAFGRMRHRRHAEHLLAVLERGHEAAHVVAAIDRLLVLLDGNGGQTGHADRYLLCLLHAPVGRDHPVAEAHAACLCGVHASAGAQPLLP